MDTSRRTLWRRILPAAVVLFLLVIPVVAVLRHFLKEGARREAGGGAAAEAPEARCPLSADKPELWPQRPYAKPSYRREERVSRKLEPSADAQTVSDGERLSVIVPGGLLKDAQVLSIAALASAESEPGMIARYSIELGDVKEFDRDVTLEFAYGPSRAVEGIPVAKQYAVSYYDDRADRWTRVPFEVDAARRRLVVRTRHLSLWDVDDQAMAAWMGPADEVVQILKSVTLRSLDSAGNARDATVTFWMRPRDNVPAAVSDAPLIRRNAQNPALKRRAGSGGGPDRCAMPFGEVAVSYFEMIWETYHAARFRLPAAMDVYITLAPGESPYYKSITGTMSLPSAQESLTELKANLAHEMFHVVQNQYLSGTSMFYFRAWWMDATADYAAAQVAWGGDAEIWKSVTQFLKPYYLEHSITYFSEVKLADAEAAAMPTVAASDAAKCARDRFHNHHYQTCVFVDHLVRKGGIDFHEMMESTLLATASNAVTPLDEYLRGKSAGKHGLFGRYRDFAADWLFATDSRIPGGGGGTTVDRSMNRSDALTEETPEAEWKVRPEPLYSAKCWEIRAARPGKAASKVVLTLVSQPETWIGSARVYLLKGRKRVPDPAAACVALLDSNSTDPVSMELAPDDGLFVMVYTGDDRAWELGFKAQLRSVAIRRPFAEVEQGVIGHEYAFGLRKSAIPDDATIRWEFSDGGVGSGDKATHTYAAAGTYTVKVSAEWGREKEEDATRVVIAPDVSAQKYEVSFCVYRKYKPPGVDPTTKNPWKASRYACQEFAIQIFEKGVQVNDTAGNLTNGIATAGLPPGSYTYRIKYRYTRPVEDAGTQEGKFTVRDDNVIVDVETPSN